MAITVKDSTGATASLRSTTNGGDQVPSHVMAGGIKGGTGIADITSTAEGTDHQALDVQIMHGGAAKDPTQIRALTSADVVTTSVLDAANFNVGQISAATSATLILALNANRRSLVICNLGTATVFVGGSGVTITTGHGVPAGAAISMRHFKGALYGVVASGTQTVSYAEESA